jgi:hypothetical protein
MQESPAIDIRVSIDGKEIDPKLFKKIPNKYDAIDMFSYDPLFGWSGGVELQISKGFHTIKIESKKANFKTEERFFIWKWNHWAHIQYSDNKIIFRMLDRQPFYF